MKKFLGFFTATLILFGAVFMIYWEYVRPSEYMIFVESFGHGVVTVDSKNTRGTDEKYRVACPNGQELTLNINPERTDSAYYDLNKLVVNGIDVTDQVNMLQYRLTATDKINVLAFFKKGKRPEGYKTESSALNVKEPDIDRYAENAYIGSYAAYDIKDPCIFYDEKSGYYYCFGSDNVVIKSKDLVNWSSRTTYFPSPSEAQSNAIMSFKSFKSVKEWAKEHGYGEDETFSDKNQDRTPLAPEIVYRDGTYYLYFSLSKTENANESAIFCVKTDNLAKAIDKKKWTDVGLVISSCGRHAGTEIKEDENGEKTKNTVKSSYDAANAVHPSIIDTKNGLFMVYGGYYGRSRIGGEIYVVELAKKTGLLKNESAYNSAGEVISTLHGSGRFQSGILIADPGRIPALTKNDGSLVSAADIAYNADTGYYYLFVTYGDSDSNYNVRVARAKTPEGPYFDFNGEKMSEFGKSARNNQYTKGYLLAGGYNFFGSGGGGVTYNDIGRASIGSPSLIKTSKGSWFMGAQSQVYFKIDETITTGVAVAEENMVPAQARPSLEVREIRWTTDGWPMASPEMYSGTKGNTKVKQADLYGNWDVVVFDNSGNSDNYTAVERSVSQTVSVLENTVISQNDTLKAKKIKPENKLTKESGFYSLTVDSVRYSIYPMTVWDWELDEGSLVFTGIGEDGSTIWGKKNFADALGINTDMFHYLVSISDEATAAKYTEKLQKISENPSQTDIDAMTGEMVDIIIAQQSK